MQIKEDGVTLLDRLKAASSGGAAAGGPANLHQAAAERIAELEDFARYVLDNSGERTMRDKAAELLT
jgi:hypothetical protein